MLRTNGILAGLVLAIVTTSASAAEDGWEFRGEFVGLKAGSDAVAIFLLTDKTRIELPLAALSEAGRSAIRSASARGAAASGDVGPMTIRDPNGRTKTLAVPPVVAAVETDAVGCRDAAEACTVYELFLFGDAMTAAEKAAAESQLAAWRKLADETRVRQGDEWLTPDQRAERRLQAKERLQHGLQLLKLDNAKLAATELEKASRLDAEDGTAEFTLGLAHAIAGGGPAKAVDHFAECVRRMPGNPWALNNLAVCEYAVGRYGNLASRFRMALEIHPQAQVVADNLGIVIAAAATSRPKVPDRVVGELNALYGSALKNLSLKPIDGASGKRPTLLSLAGEACVPGPIASVVKFLEPPADWIKGGSIASGVVVAEGYVLTSRRKLGGACEVWVEDPSKPGFRLPATIAGSLEHVGVILLQCDGLSLPPVPPGDGWPAVGGEILACNRLGGSLSNLKPELARGRTLRAIGDDPKGRGIHTAVVTRGGGGGPIADATGRLVGLVAETPKTEASGNARGLGIPLDTIRPLLEEQLAGFAPAQAEDPAPTWEKIEARFGQSMVRVVVVEKHTEPSLE